MRYSEHEWFSPYMQPDETVLWRGRPDKHEALVWTELVKGAPMLLMVGWGGYMLYLVLFNNNGMPSAVEYVAAGLILLWLFFAIWIGFVGPARHALAVRNAEYVITSRRILRKIGNVVDGLDGALLPPRNLKRGAMHYGDIEFGYWPVPQTSRISRKPSLAVAASFRLTAIPHAEDVMRLLHQMDTSRPAVLLSEKPDFPLEEGEQLLWQGHPEKTGLPLTFSMHLNVDDLFGGLWCTLLGGIATGLMIWVMVSEWPDVPLVLPLVTLPFAGACAFGLYKLGLGSLRIHRRAGREEYFITTRRVIRRTGSRVESHDLAQDNVLCLCQGRDGCGTIVMGNATAPFRKRIRPRGGPDLAQHPGFQLRHIPDPTRAMDALRTLSPKEEDPCTS